MVIAVLVDFLPDQTVSVLTCSQRTGRCLVSLLLLCLFFSSRRRHTRCSRDWSSDVCSSDLLEKRQRGGVLRLDRIRVLTDGQPRAAIPLQRVMPIGGESKYREDVGICEHGTKWREIGRASCRERV